MDAGDWMRNVLGQYPTGVSIVTAVGEDGAPVGMVVGSFTSVSLEPPLVAFLPSASSSSWGKMRSATAFCVNFLAADQEDVCRTFASKTADKFAAVSWRSSSSGAPILDGAVAWIDCTRETVHDAGDHQIVVLRVQQLDLERPGPPLVFFQGGYGRFAPLSLATRDERFARQLQLLDLARPRMEDCAARLGVALLASHCDGHELTLLAIAGTGTAATVDAALARAAIGQRLPVAAPVGIWWMAHADEIHVDSWLEMVTAPAQRARYREALTAIRQAGYCLGVGRVQLELGDLAAARAGVGGEPTRRERERLHTLGADPMDFAPTPDRLAAVARGMSDVVAMWAPVAGGDGLGIGLMLDGVEDEAGLAERARELLTFAAEVAVPVTASRLPAARD